MVFSKPIFLFAFLPIVLILYYLCPKRQRNIVLLVMSLIFYAWGEPRLVLLMLATILVDYISGRIMGRFLYGDENRRAAKITLILTVIINLGFLCYFKYANFIIDNVNAIVGGKIDPLNVLLPIGISFYTFQSMSYIIDVYRKIVPAEKNVLNFATYVTLFPQLIAGPIVQYKTVAGELSCRHETVDLFAEGIWRFSIGLGKKVLLANQIGALWTTISADTAGMTAGKAWIGALAYTFQIYFDFSGYSDMAIGLGKMFGFNFLENFDHPYVSKSITEFWRRWHISLSTWFKEYVYIPLGGNRKGLPRQIVNILIVWMLTGLWHGASWNFVVWGLYFGIILAIEKLFLLKFLNKVPAFFSHAYSLVLIIAGWVIFECGTLGQIGGYFKAMLGIGVSGWSGETTYYLLNNLFLFVVLALCSTDLCKKIGSKMKNGYWKCAGAAVLLILSVVFLAGDSYNPFMYFRF